MDYIKLNEQIKQNKMEKVYLFNVGEDYIANALLNNLKSKVLNEATSELNFNVFEDKNIPLSQITSAIEAMPIMDKRRIVYVSDNIFLSNKDTSKSFSDIVKNIPDYTILILYNKKGKIDKRSALYKQVKANGGIVDFEKLKEYKLNSWIRDRLSNENIRLSNDAMRYFVESSGYTLDDSDADLGYFIKEIEKLKVYKGEQISLDMIRKIISVNINEEIFKLSDNLIKKNRQKSYELYMNLKYNDVKFVSILAVVMRNMENIFIAKSYINQRKSENDMAKDYSIHPYSAKIAMQNARKFTKRQINDNLNLCMELDFKLKSGEVSDYEAGLILIENILS